MQIGDAVDIIAEILEPPAQAKGIDIIMNISDDLPVVETDAVKVNQILENIIGNAVKFTEEGAVRISVESIPEHILIHVEDSGVGISESDLPHIFKAFSQADGTTAGKFEGSGLGLAIADKLSGLIGAAISVKSERRKGTTFKISLPVKWKGGLHEPGGPKQNKSGSLETPSEIPEPEFTTPAAGLESSPPARILIVEDNPDNMAAIKAVLNGNYGVIEAVDGKEGIDKAFRENPDLILLDMALPVMDGFTVVRRLKSDSRVKDIPVIALTAYAMKGDREKILRAGCNDYFAKPADPEKILNTIRFLLEAGSKKDPTP